MPDSRGKYTLDELLRAKRNERPNPEFWVAFDRELKSKQRLLIQSQLAKETRVKSPFAARIYKFSAVTASFGVAAFAVYLGFQPSTQDAPAVSVADKEDAPRFEVAVAKPQVRATVSQPTGLREFSTLAQPSSPKVVVRTSTQQPVVAETAKPTRSQLTAMSTLAELESTIRANRASGPSATPSYQFVSSASLFDSELTEVASVEDQGHLDTWDLENAYLLGKYADPLTGNLSALGRNPSLSEIQNVSFSQLDDAISSQSRRRSRSIDALTVSF